MTSAIRYGPHGTRRATLTAALVAATVGLIGPAAWAATDPDLDQTVEADEATAEGGVVIEAGHVDLGARFIDDVWRFQARDDRQMPPVWRFAEDVVFHVTDAAVLAAPDNPDFGFLEVEPGTPVHVIPQTQDPAVVWLGWNTQDPEVVERIDRGASLTLHAVDGPGEVFLFLQEGVAGAPNVLWNSTDPYPQDLWMETNTHTHANWVFTEPGDYRLQAEVHTELTDGAAVSDTVTLRFAVGDDTDPQALLAADDQMPLPAAPADGQTAADTTADGDGETVATSIVIAVGLGALVLLGAVIAFLVTSRRTREHARTEAASSAREHRP